MKISFLTRAFHLYNRRKVSFTVIEFPLKSPPYPNNNPQDEFPYPIPLPLNLPIPHPWNPEYPFPEHRFPQQNTPIPQWVIN